MFLGWGAAIRQSQRNLAHAHLSHSKQRSLLGLYTVMKVHLSMCPIKYSAIFMQVKFQIHASGYIFSVPNAQEPGRTTEPFQTAWRRVSLYCRKSKPKFLMAMTLKIIVSGMSPCSLVYIYQLFGENFCLHLQDGYWRKQFRPSIAKFIRYDTTSYSRKQYSSADIFTKKVTTQIGRNISAHEC